MKSLKVDKKSVKHDYSKLKIDRAQDVAKVVESRIYAVEFHPSPSCLLAAAGDKMGNVGLWKIDAVDEESDGLSSLRSRLFALYLRFHHF
jgi:hypothetical protein